LRIIADKNKKKEPFRMAAECLMKEVDSTLFIIAKIFDVRQKRGLFAQTTVIFLLSIRENYLSLHRRKEQENEFLPLETKDNKYIG